MLVPGSQVHALETSPQTLKVEKSIAVQSSALYLRLVAVYIYIGNAILETRYTNANLM